MSWAEFVRKNSPIIAPSVVPHTEGDGSALGNIDLVPFSLAATSSGAPQCGRERAGLKNSALRSVSLESWVRDIIPFLSEVREVFALGATCMRLRGATRHPAVWDGLEEGFWRNYEALSGRGRPQLIFSSPLEMSQLLPRLPKGHPSPTGAAVSPVISAASSPPVTISDLSTVREKQIKTFIRLSKFCTNDIRRDWHLKELIASEPCLHINTDRNIRHHQSMRGGRCNAAKLKGRQQRYLEWRPFSVPCSTVRAGTLSGSGEADYVNGEFDSHTIILSQDNGDSDPTTEEVRSMVAETDLTIYTVDRHGSSSGCSPYLDPGMLEIICSAIKEEAMAHAKIPDIIDTTEANSCTYITVMSHILATIGSRTPQGHYRPFATRAQLIEISLEEAKRVADVLFSESVFSSSRPYNTSSASMMARYSSQQGAPSPAFATGSNTILQNNIVIIDENETRCFVSPQLTRGRGPVTSMEMGIVIVDPCMVMVVWAPP
eukprot:Tbor_TRINITY_DN9922_c0_g1::TRINITY_DN9922_c0_g1_i1::g.17684::m.17684